MSWLHLLEHAGTGSVEAWLQHRSPDQSGQHGHERQTLGVGGCVCECQGIECARICACQGMCVHECVSVRMCVRVSGDECVCA